MAALLANLGGNPLNTPVGQKIGEPKTACLQTGELRLLSPVCKHAVFGSPDEKGYFFIDPSKRVEFSQLYEQATDASLPSENWTLNMEICDLINETDEGPKDAVKAIRKRLQQNTGKNYTVVLYALTVLETCVKNCGRRFHLLISQKDFIMDLVKLIGPKNDPPTAVQEKILSLIQSWADAFQSNTEMQGVVQVYHDLKQKGIEFPMTDLDTMAPIHTPQRSVPASTSPVPSHPEPIMHATQLPAQPIITNPMPDVLPRQTGPINLNPEQLAKLRSELDTVQGNMKVFGEMLTELTPGKEHPQDLELLQELQKTCCAMQNRIVDLIDKIGMEEVTSDLLRINDELNNLFLRYERYDKKRTTILSSLESKLQAVPVENPLDKPLIDFGDTSEEVDQASASIANINLQEQVTTKNSVADEFDMFAQSRNTSFETNKTRSSTYADNTNLDQIEGGLAAFAVGKGNPNGVSSSTISPDQSNSGTTATANVSAVNNRRHMDKDDDNALFAL